MNMPSLVVGSNRKIDPYRRRVSTGPLLPDGSPNDGNRVEIGPTDLAFEEWAAKGLTAPDLTRLREYRHHRLVSELHKQNVDALLMFDPLNIRYATDTTNMQLWVTHNPCRACLVTADGHMVLWDFHASDHLSSHLPLVKELRHGASFFYIESGDRGEEHAGKFADEVVDIVKNRIGDGKRLAVDKIEVAGLRALENREIDHISGRPQPVEMRRVLLAKEVAIADQPDRRRQSGQIGCTRRRGIGRGCLTAQIQLPSQPVLGRAP